MDMSLEELFDMFLNNEYVMKRFKNNIWPDGRICPRCGYKHTCVAKHPLIPYYRSEYKKRLGAGTETTMKHSRIGYRK